MLRVKEALDSGCLKPAPCDGHVDNDALRLAVGRGSSAKLGHVRVHAETCFRFLAQLPISLHRVGTTEKGGRHHEKGFLGGATLTQYLWPALCRHEGWQSLGGPNEVFSCSCAGALLLSKLAEV